MTCSHAPNLRVLQHCVDRAGCLDLYQMPSGPCCCCCDCAQVSLLHRREVMRKEHRVLLGLHELLTYGLKGVAAYAHHAEMLGKVDPKLDDMFEEVRRGGDICAVVMDFFAGCLCSVFWCGCAG